MFLPLSPSMLALPLNFTDKKGDKRGWGVCVWGVEAGFPVLGDTFKVCKFLKSLQLTSKGFKTSTSLSSLSAKIAVKKKKTNKQTNKPENCFHGKKKY